MKQKLMIFALFLIIGLPCLNVAVSTFQKPAWADQASLASQKPKGSDTDQLYTAANAAYAVNWQNMVQYTFQAVNWISLGFSQPTGGVGGGINWTLPNVYVGG